MNYLTIGLSTLCLIKIYSLIIMPLLLTKSGKQFQLIGEKIVKQIQTLSTKQESIRKMGILQKIHSILLQLLHIAQTRINPVISGHGASVS